MKLRWRNLQERMRRVELEMQNVQELLSDLSQNARTSLDASASNPSRPWNGPLRSKSDNMLAPTPPRNGSTLNQRAVSPFRKIVNRLKSSRGRDESPPPVPQIPRQPSHSPVSSTASSSIYSEHYSEQAGMRRASSAYSTPPRLEASRAGSHQHGYTGSTVGLPPVPSNHAYEQKTVRDQARGSKSPGPRASSAFGTASAAKPKWNTSTKLPADDLASSVRPSSTNNHDLFPFDTPTRTLSPSSGYGSGQMTPSSPAATTEMVEWGRRAAVSRDTRA